MTNPVLAAALEGVLAFETARAAAPSDVWGEHTGFAALNLVTGGLQPGFNVLAARPSHGKTALSMQIATNIAHTIFGEWEQTPGPAPPGQVLVFSPEMRVTDLMERYATQQARVPLEDIKRGLAPPAQRQLWREKAEEFALLGEVLRLHAGRAYTWAEIKDIVEYALMAGPPVRLVLIDYVQRLTLGGNLGRENEYTAQRVISTELKNLANANDLPILAAAQLNKVIDKDRRAGGPVDREPDLADLYGGALDFDADTIWLLWRPPEEQENHSGVGVPQHAVVRVAKNRHGRTGRAALLYYPRLVLFEDPAHLQPSSAAL